MCFFLDVTYLFEEYFHTIRMFINNSIGVTILPNFLDIRIIDDTLIEVTQEKKFWAQMFQAIPDFPMFGVTYNDYLRIPNAVQFDLQEEIKKTHYLAESIKPGFFEKARNVIVGMTRGPGPISTS